MTPEGGHFLIASMIFACQFLLSVRSLLIKIRIEHIDLTYFCRMLNPLSYGNFSVIWYNVVTAKTN